MVDISPQTIAKEQSSSLEQLINQLEQTLVSVRPDIIALHSKEDPSTNEKRNHEWEKHRAQLAILAVAEKKLAELKTSTTSQIDREKAVKQLTKIVEEVTREGAFSEGLSLVFPSYGTQTVERIDFGLTPQPSLTDVHALLNLQSTPYLTERTSTEIQANPDDFSAKSPLFGRYTQSEGIQTEQKGMLLTLGEVTNAARPGESLNGVVVYAFFPEMQVNQKLGSSPVQIMMRPFSPTDIAKNPTIV